MLAIANEPKWGDLFHDLIFLLHCLILVMGEIYSFYLIKIQSKRVNIIEINPNIT